MWPSLRRTHVLYNILRFLAFQQISYRRYDAKCDFLRAGVLLLDVWHRTWHKHSVWHGRLPSLLWRFAFLSAHKILSEMAVFRRRVFCLSTVSYSTRSVAATGNLVLHYYNNFFLKKTSHILYYIVISSVVYDRHTK